MERVNFWIYVLVGTGTEHGDPCTSEKPNLLFGSQGSFITPGYDDIYFPHYENNLNCHWLITVPNDKVSTMMV